MDDDDFPVLDDPEDEDDPNHTEHDNPLPPPTPPGGDDQRDEYGRPWLGPDESSFSDETFLRAIKTAMHRIRAFLLLHKDEPKAIAARLSRFERVIRAAAAHQSPLRRDVIRLGLALEPRYWLAAGRVEEGFSFFGHLFSYARDLGDAQLWGEVLTVWGQYQFLLRRRDAGRIAFEWALEKIAETDRADLRLLLQVEVFNAQVFQLSSEQAEAQAAELLAEAARLKFPNVRGRVYLSLSRRCQYVDDRAHAFEYAQQSLCYFYPDNTLELATQALGGMYMNLTTRSDTTDALSNTYTDYLFAKWEQFVERNINPWYRAAALHVQTHQLYQQGYYQRAGRVILRAWRAYCRIADELGKAQIRHMAGMVCLKLGAWEQASHYFVKAQAHYEALGETLQALHAQHAAAYVPVERAAQEPNVQLAKMYLRYAEIRLLATRQAIEERVATSEMKEYMLSLIDEDIAAVKRRLACGTSKWGRQSAN